MRKLLLILCCAILATYSMPTRAQNNNPDTQNPEDRDVDMDAPTFDPMVKVG